MIHYLTRHPEAFDPETVQILSTVLDDAWARIQASGARFNGNSDEARNALAKHIVDLAKLGERNPRQFIDEALIRFSL